MKRLAHTIYKVTSSSTSLLVSLSSRTCWKELRCVSLRVLLKRMKPTAPKKTRVSTDHIDWAPELAQAKDQELISWLSETLSRLEEPTRTSSTTTTSSSQPSDTSVVWIASAPPLPKTSGEQKSPLPYTLACPESVNPTVAHPLTRITSMEMGGNRVSGCVTKGKRKYVVHYTQIVEPAALKKKLDFKQNPLHTNTAAGTLPAAS